MTLTQFVGKRGQVGPQAISRRGAGLLCWAKISLGSGLAHCLTHHAYGHHHRTAASCGAVQSCCTSQAAVVSASRVPTAYQSASVVRSMEGIYTPAGHYLATVCNIEHPADTGTYNGLSAVQAWCSAASNQHTWPQPTLQKA